MRWTHRFLSTKNLKEMRAHFWIGGELFLLIRTCVPVEKTVPLALWFLALPRRIERG